MPRPVPPARLLPLVAALAACAHASPDGGVPPWDIEDVDVRPVLIGCPGYETPGAGGRAWGYAELIVSDEGKVVSAIPWRSTWGGGSREEAQARSMEVVRVARTCTYEPGYVGSMPVPVKGVRLGLRVGGTP